ncbi:hypothetical protein JY97_04020 [Alkalispirochaeta odontotermitis]|nr:hypothetical protein JY97_04020 [Alkalispirochaeta odontotermitis]
MSYHFHPEVQFKSLQLLIIAVDRLIGSAGSNEVLGSGHGNISKNKLKRPENTHFSGLIDQFSCKN